MGIQRHGPRKWENLHVTEDTQLADLIDVDNSVAGGTQSTGFALLKQVAREMDGLVQEARQQGKRVRALGSGWALSNIAITDGWLINTKLLNGCFDISDPYFEASYPQAKRQYAVIVQCGMSIGELNVHLEVTATVGFRRALKTSGIGAGQTIAGAVSGNTHGSAINFGATPDYVVGLHVVTGSGKSLWIERASYPVLNDEFAAKLDADLIRDDDIFGAALVSFGAFGVIVGVAIETAPIYQLNFPQVHDIAHDDLKAKLNNFNFNNPPALYHYEFVFNPYSKNNLAMEALATKVDFQPGFPVPDPVWIIRNSSGLAPGDQAGKAFFALPLPAATKADFQFDQYRQHCILGNGRGTPGQVFTATVTYLEGYTESALGVSITDAAKMMEISTAVINQMDLPAISQVRLVHPSQALLAFTHLGPKTAVFEFGLAHDGKVAVFEQTLADELTGAGVGFTFHWSKNSGIDSAKLLAMYGAERIAKWRQARSAVFKNDGALMRVFENDQLVRAGLA